MIFCNYTTGSSSSVNILNSASFLENSSKEPNDFNASSITLSALFFKGFFAPFLIFLIYFYESFQGFSIFFLL